jgi:hypothetical protein
LLVLISLEHIHSNYISAKEIDNFYVEWNVFILTYKNSTNKFHEVFFHVLKNRNLYWITDCDVNGKVCRSKN